MNTFKSLLIQGLTFSNNDGDKSHQEVAALLRNASRDAF